MRRAVQAGACRVALRGASHGASHGALAHGASHGALAHGASGCGALAHGPVRASHACGEMRGSKLAQSKWSDASRLLPVSLRQQFRLPSSATLTYIESSKRT